MNPEIYLKRGHCHRVERCLRVELSGAFKEL